MVIVKRHLIKNEQQMFLVLLGKKLLFVSKATKFIIKINRFTWDDSVSRRPLFGRHRVTTPAEDRLLVLSVIRKIIKTVPQLISTYFITSGTRISATSVTCYLHYSDLCASCVYLTEPMTEKYPFMLAKRTRLMHQISMDFCTIPRWVQVDTFRASVI